MPSDAFNSVMFTGEFRHGIDPKNRVTIPADWRSGEAQSFYVRIDSTGSCIHVMPPEEFRKTVDRFFNASELSPAQRQVAVRQFSAGAQMCNADKQGRMVLPPEFCARIGLAGEVVLVGVVDRFEIWNSTRWDAASAENTPYLNAASQLGL